jgi:C-terminal processing protease CtpA/Prc
MVSEDETDFVHSTLLSEEIIISTELEEFQPRYSPDGKEVAYLEERTTLKVINLETKKTRTILDGTLNYSYDDGDQYFDWSPDGKWFLVKYCPFHLFMEEVGLVSANGGETVINLTQSGYSDGTPKWALDGKMMIWFTDREGMRSHGSWGSQWDIYGMFFTQDAYDQFIKTKEEAEVTADKEGDKDSSVNVIVEFDGLDDRIERLTINSSSISDAVLSPDGEKLYYLTKFDDGYDLWVHDFKEAETKLVTNLTGFGKQLKIDKEGENLFMFSGTKIIKISTKDYSKETVSFEAEKYLDLTAERGYLFEHIWRQIKEKFYVENMHDVDWEFYKSEYIKFLPHIENNYDFSEMVSEMLGELNASHTGCGYIVPESGDETGKLGAFYDWSYYEDGLKIVEIIEKGPLKKSDSKIEIGTIIQKIDGTEIKADEDYFHLLNHKAGKNVLLSLYDPKTKKSWEEIIKPITPADENQLLYERWVKQRQEETEILSGGKIGYVHVKVMNEESFREVFSEMLGKYYDAKAIIIDTRYNTGGWLHDDLVNLLNGVKYTELSPRGHIFGYDPMTKWVKPSIVLINESNYSDAHAFPYAYKTLGLGETVGMPVPGTMTAVWWETLIDKTLYFGMPEVGALDINGNYLENNQLEPDYKIENDYNILIKGRDQQLEKAVEVLLKEIE